MNQIFMNVKEVSEKLGVSRTKAYNTIREWNDELKSMGYFTKSGSVPRRSATDTKSRNNKEAGNCPGCNRGRGTGC